MINDQSVLAVVPARAGSKRMPGKNVALLGGKPLIQWSIEAALAAVEVDRVIVSTDSADVARIAASCGADVPFLRPPELSGDDVPGVAPIVHAVTVLPGYDIVVLLQPTSPLRTVDDISRSLQLMLVRGADGVVSVSPAKAHPNWMKRIGRDDRLEPLLDEPLIACSQDLPPVYYLNGAIYGASVSQFVELQTFQLPHTVGYVMPGSRSLDIDTAEDLALAEWQLYRKTPSVDPD